MKYTNEYLLELFTTNGINEALNMIDIDKIDDDYIKIISRTIKFSSEVLIKELDARIKNRSKN